MSGHPEIAVIVVAAGEGTRLGAGVPKAFVDLAGSTLLERTVHAVLGMPDPVQVVVVAPGAHMERAASLVEFAAGRAAEYVQVVAGGASRSASVREGLEALDSSVEIVLVHDAARALAPSAFLASIAAAVVAHGEAIVPGLPVVDTIKEIDAEDRVLGTVDRAALRAVQTPQGFPRALIDAAYRASVDEHTDDAATVAAAGGRIRVVPGHERAFKITTPWDLRRAELLLRPAGLRTGIGVDVHAVGTGGVLRLAALEWPGEDALDGHSDGDAVAHAMVDALLGAAGLGDIGSMFGTDDPRLAGASGETFLRAAIDALAVAGFEPVNVAVQLVGNRPRFAARRAEAEAVLGRIVGAPVSIAATTTDGLGFTGRGEGVTAIASALVQARGGAHLE
jgi:2-C-methyl-D-erythritol 4-phosphate cytidylyltransferase/2-C-methyl-D-erythritol 2,4-cyclodiphosphate synthase